MIISFELVLILASFGNFSIISALTVAKEKNIGIRLKNVVFIVLDRTHYGSTMHVKSQNAGITKIKEAQIFNESVKIGNQV